MNRRISYGLKKIEIETVGQLTAFKKKIVKCRTEQAHTDNRQFLRLASSFARQQKNRPPFVEQHSCF